MKILTINDVKYQIPERWSEFPFSKFEELAFAEDQVFVLTGIPSVVIECFDEVTKQQIADCLMAFSVMPKGTVDKLVINDLPFQVYLNASYAYKANDKVAFVRAFYPDASDDCECCIPRYNAANQAWAEFHHYWSWLETKPDPEWKAAGINRLDKYGNYAMLAQMANRDLQLEAFIVNLPTKDVFTHRAYWSEMDEVITAYQRNRGRNGKGNI